jgi:hypothetical protein
MSAASPKQYLCRRCERCVARRADGLQWCDSFHFVNCAASHKHFGSSGSIHVCASGGFLRHHFGNPFHNGDHSCGRTQWRWYTSHCVHSSCAFGCHIPGLVTLVEFEAGPDIPGTVDSVGRETGNDAFFRVASQNDGTLVSRGIPWHSHGTSGRRCRRHHPARQYHHTCATRLAWHTHLHRSTLPFQQSGQVRGPRCGTTSPVVLPPPAASRDAILFCNHLR